MDIRVIEDKDKKQQIARLILEALQDWFEISESRENYIRKTRSFHLQLHTMKTGRLVLRSLRCFLCYGMKIIPARYM